MDFLLQATVYQPPSRPGRRQLNTIVEDNEETNNGVMSDGEGTLSDSTVIGKPCVADAKDTSQPANRSRQRAQTLSRRPPSVVSSDCDEEEEEEEALHHSSRNSYAGSDAGTVFSDTCPSLNSEATTFVTDSSRNSVGSRGSRGRCPSLSLLIPWSSSELNVKQMPLGMSPSIKVVLSPEVLKKLPTHIPSIDAPPSFGDASSVRSVSPCSHAINSAPVTPNLQQVEIVPGQSWGVPAHQLALTTPLEIAVEGGQNIILAPHEAHSSLRSSVRLSSGDNDIMSQFPEIPGATPFKHTPVTPSLLPAEALDALTGDSGVQLPAQALEILKSLDEQRYAESKANSSTFGDEVEMKERVVPETRPQSWSGMTPISDYSISRLSVPSLDGFFSTLDVEARNTWGIPQRKTSPPPPSSTTAENFYKTPWSQTSKVKETIIEHDNGDGTDGPPTVKRSTFDLGVQVQTPLEDEDMYGGEEKPKLVPEYEEAYEEELKQAAEVNMDRTSNWLAAQTTYLSALRETNPLNNPADFPVASDLSAEVFARKDSIDGENQTAVRFLQVAKAAVSPGAGAGSITSSPAKETMFLQAFMCQKSETKRSDAFLYASSRLDSVQSTRIATPRRHLQTLLNNHTSKTLEPDYARPKYRGPFSQNPRNTGDFTKTAEQAQYHTLERQQTALNAIQPNLWSLEAQRSIFYNGRLMANRMAWERITKKDTEFAESSEAEKSIRKRPRVLDLAGAATASWAWAAASKWPNARVYTVRTKEQADLATSYPPSKDDNTDACKPETPTNHKVFSVPFLWQMPFRDNFFDVVSARTLHMYLRANPVPGNKDINEWDLTLRECMRILKPGGVLDFFVMDSGISNGEPSKTAINLSPSVMSSTRSLQPNMQDATHTNITSELKSMLEDSGYEVDGGCGHLMSRLKQEGFVGVKRQWIGLPMGRVDNESAATQTHHRNGSSASSASATSHWINQTQITTSSRRPTFRYAPRPISEVSEISRILDQYAGVEAVQGPVGSTYDVSAMSALLGELLWEEWLVRLRIESGDYTPETILNGVDEQFAEWRRSGEVAWRGVIGWARKPTSKATRASKSSGVSGSVSTAQNTSLQFGAGFAIETPLPTPASLPASAPVGVHRRSSVRRTKPSSDSFSIKVGLSINTDINSNRSGEGDWSRQVNEVSLEDYTKSALDRGEVGEIPMMIVG